MSIIVSYFRSEFRLPNDCMHSIIVQFSHEYMTTGKTIALTRWTFVDKVMSLLFNMLSAAKSLQSCLTLCNPMDGSPPGYPISGILRARTLEWVAIAFFEKMNGHIKNF